MQGTPVEMRHIREVLRLRALGVSGQKISYSVGLARSTVGDILKRANDAGLSWPIEIGDEALAAAIYKRPSPSARLGARRWAEPDWAQIHLEMKRPHVTLALLWEEYRSEQRDGYAYSRFCELYRAFAGRLSPTMRQAHAAGDKMFVDFAGAKIPVLIDRLTGEQRDAQLFVAVLGASSKTYVEATWTQTTADWVGAQGRALNFYGGSPRLLVPDNPKATIVRACRYEPSVQRTYGDFAAWYGIGVLPARVRKPRDKAKVEVGVQLAQRWIVAALRNRTFHSLAELNVAIAELCKKLNDKPMRRLKQSRSQLFEAVERPALRPLPAEDYVYAEWKICRVGLDYHVEIDRHYYSVPHRYLRAEVEARISARTVEIFLKNQLIAAHRRETTCGRHTTLPEHMPESHRAYAGATLAKIIAEAEAIGPSVGMLIQLIVEEKDHPEQAVRTGVGLVRLARPYGRARLDRAALIALKTGSLSYGAVRAILESERDLKRTVDDEPGAPKATPHANIRGRNYYN